MVYGPPLNKPYHRPNLDSDFTAKAPVSRKSISLMEKKHGFESIYD